jgi:hypothetical protein
MTAVHYGLGRNKKKRFSGEGAMALVNPDSIWNKRDAAQLYGASAHRRITNII